MAEGPSYTFLGAQRPIDDNSNVVNGPSTLGWAKACAMMEFMRPEPDDKPIVPTKSDEEAGIGWGEAPETDDDERLRRERPPHWDA